MLLATAIKKSKYSITEIMDLSRDFTYIDVIIESVIRLISKQSVPAEG